MSDLKKRGFEANPWKEAAGQGRGNAPDTGDDFKALYSGKKTAATRGGFVASFVSPEKARTLVKNQPEDEPAAEVPRESLEEIEGRAYEAGFSKGEMAGLEEGRRKAGEAIERMAGVLSELDAAWRTLIRTHETRIIELIGRAVEKVVYAKAAVDQEMVKRAILEAFRVVPEPVNVTISVNPKDYEYIETVKEDFFSRIKGLKDVSVSPDSAVHPGGCIVRTKFGEVDASLETRLESIRESLIRANGRKPL